jgi:hypothetical protein
MTNYNWQDTFLALFQKGLAAYQKGNSNPETYFSASEVADLKSIGHTVRELFDFIEDHARGANLPSAMALQIATVRRDYFLRVQNGQWTGKTLPPSQLPAKSAEVDGIEWLPRLIAKARIKLRGEMDPDTMYGCGGDRAFFDEYDIHPADFLRVTWEAGENDRAIIDYVKAAAKA